MAPTHVPERTCVGCRAKAPKTELLRIVRASDGTVGPDPTGSALGRGAYLHRERSCVDVALQRGGLARALRTRLDERGAATLRADIEGALVP